MIHDSVRLSLQNPGTRQIERKIMNHWTGPFFRPDPPKKKIKEWIARDEADMAAFKVAKKKS